MAEIRAFRGWRYDLGRVGALEDVIAPPYDVIDEELSEQLHSRSDYNVIRLILDPILPSDTDEENRYTRTARRMKLWRQDGFLTEERAPCLYVYSQTFDWEGRSYTRLGFMSRVRLEEFGSGKIFPHEETMPGPKADRLKLFHSTGMNLSQIFAIYPDESKAISSRLAEAVRSLTPLEAVDDLEVTHRLWTFSGAKTITDLQGLLGPKPIFIADGHHRYETSLAHLRDRLETKKVTGPDDPANFTLMMLVGMNEPGLRVMPTHRLVTGIGDLDAEELKRRLEDHFETEVLGKGEEAGLETWKRIEASGRQHTLGFGTASDDTWTLSTLRRPASMDSVVSDHSEVWKSLGVSILHELVLEHCFEGKGQLQCRYVHSVGEVFGSLDAGNCQLACLVQPATVEHIRQLAGTFEKMPAKSTYFYPKLASGLVFNPIHGA